MWQTAVTANNVQNVINVIKISDIEKISNSAPHISHKHEPRVRSCKQECHNYEVHAANCFDYL